MGDLAGSLALADECARQDDEILFLVSAGGEAVELLKERGHPFQVVASPEAEPSILRAFRPDVILVNRLENTPAYIEALKAYGGLVVTLDDAGEGGARADLRINVLYHAAGAVTDMDYIALRQEFQATHRQTRAVRSGVRELVVTQGGSDTFGFTPRIIRSLEGLACRPHCTVVVGPAFRHLAELEEAVRASTMDLTVIHHARNMAELMGRADLAITAGGLTMFELACVGTPSVVICAERFEVETAARLERAGAVVSLGFGEDLNYDRVPSAVEELAGNPERRRQMSARGKALVDGRGCERIVRLIRSRLAERGGVLS
jgi:spore coat polysaccharide biosynthesis predicted glycosyltransferase SpsG